MSASDGKHGGAGGTSIPARDHRVLSLAVPCESCGRWTERELGPRGSRLPDSLTCSHCGVPQRLALAAHLDAAGELDGCPRCGYHTLCIQKDVNPRLGVAIVVLSFLGLLLADLELTGLITGLVVLTLIDLALLRLVVRRFLICYRCKAQYRGFPPGPGCRPFDLATWEVHDGPPAGQGPASS